MPDVSLTLSYTEANVCKSQIHIVHIKVYFLLNISEHHVEQDETLCFITLFHMRQHNYLY